MGQPEKVQRKIGIIDWAIGGVAIAMIAYHLFDVASHHFDSILHQNIHLGFAMVLLFLATIKTVKRRWLVPIMLVGILFSLVCVIYVHVNCDRLNLFPGFPEGMDVIVGIGLIVLVIALTWQAWGWIFPTLVMISILYALFGHYAPGALRHSWVEPGLVLSQLSIGLQGIYGSLLNASASIVFLFIIFGGLFNTVGIDKFFIEIGNWIGNRVRGGAAQIAVFSSAFVGMCTGAAMANVAITGAYTIPLMKKVGYTPEQAGAIEAYASTGGQVTPPVMGVAIFLMASFLGIGYGGLMMKAIVPAVLYYVVGVLGVLLIANKQGIPKLGTEVRGTLVAQLAPVFIIPMSVLTFLLVKRYSPAYAATFAIAALLLISLIQKQTRPSLPALTRGLISGAVMGATLAVAIAAIGMFAKMLIFTGAGIKLAALIEAVSSGHLIVALLLTMLLSILLGCALPTAVAYVLVALIVAPALMRMGMDKLPAHFFVFYYAVLSAITPPIAGASIVAAQIAETSYWKTSWESFKLAVPFLVVPFFLVYNPIVLTESQEPIGAILALLSVAVAILALMVATQNRCFTKLSRLERGLFFLTSGIAVYAGLWGWNYLFFTISTILFIALLLVQFRKMKSAMVVAEVLASPRQDSPT